MDGDPGFKNDPDDLADRARLAKIGRNPDGSFAPGAERWTVQIPRTRFQQLEAVFKQIDESFLKDLPIDSPKGVPKSVFSLLYKQFKTGFEDTKSEVILKCPKCEKSFPYKVPTQTQNAKDKIAVLARGGLINKFFPDLQKMQVDINVEQGFHETINYYDDVIKKVLTEEQKKVVNQMFKERRQQLLISQSGNAGS